MVGVYGEHIMWRTDKQLPKLKSRVPCEVVFKQGEHFVKVRENCVSFLILIQMLCVNFLY